MDHFGGHVIESARAQLGAFAFACQHSLSGNHGVRLVSRMPMLSDVDRFRGADEHVGSMRCRINTKKTNFRRFFSEIGNNLVLFQIGHIFESRPIAGRRCRLGCLRTKIGQRQQCQRQKNRKIESCFHDRVNRSDISVPQELLCCCSPGSCPRTRDHRSRLQRIDESDR